MPSTPLRIALLGGVPPSLGGGGLEIQRDMTALALRDRGHIVFNVSGEAEPREFDLLHVFGSEPDVWHTLRHWRRNRAPLVVSPVIVAPAGAKFRLRVAAHVAKPLTPARMRRDLLRRADLLVALTRHERSVLSRLAPGVPSVVVGNGVDDCDVTAPDLVLKDVRRPYVVLLGTVSPRKRQADSLRALVESAVQPVVIGGFEGGADDRAAFEEVVAETGTQWLGELVDRSLVRGILRDAAALIHLSSAEGQSLAVLEALAQGTQVICSPLPANLELAEDFPGLVKVCRGREELTALVTGQAISPPSRAIIPSWSDVALALEARYLSLVRR